MKGRRCCPEEPPGRPDGELIGGVIARARRLEEGEGGRERGGIEATAGTFGGAETAGRCCLWNETW